MEAIDFSPMHDVLICYEDGTLRPFDEPHFEAHQVDEETWQIASSGDYHYLITGDEIGVAIDTGYGAGNLRDYLEDLCGKPVPWVINTHHHFDHTAGDYYFDRAYMAKGSFAEAAVPYESFSSIEFPEMDFEKIAVGDGDYIPLEGRPLEVFEIGDHTDDGIALLDRSHRILFAGDEFMPGMKTLNGSVTRWKNGLAKLMPHRDEFDIVCGGPAIVDASIVDIFYQAACNILDGKESEEKPYADQDAGPGPHAEYDDEGHEIYDWKRPHFEDMPKGGFFKEDPNMVEYIYKGYVFTYDKTMM